ncbi:hypothetical protein JWG40_10480 [Leptospira sp. 201903074]|uniref:hypothetical protein n=1 Tax=Leptospira abararensis TaxID=2810036 RepID=UPI0019665364|nr:hypothetical protein [Leptospira abararensis]MBM9547443.1 hypothetical protein [Leptospira abararensis]
MKIKETDFTHRQAVQFFKQFAESLLGTGHLETNDFYDKEVLNKKILKIVRKSNLNLVIDHRNEIKKLAEQFSADNYLEVSVIFYALYFEHTLNYIIFLQLTKVKKSNEVIKNIIKKSNIEEKLGWVLELIGLPKINSKYKKVIISVSKERNIFIHYKWLEDTMDYRINLKNLTKSTEINKAITYLKKYESKLKFNGNKNIWKKSRKKRIKGNLI